MTTIDDLKIIEKIVIALFDQIDEQFEKDMDLYDISLDDFEIQVRAVYLTDGSNERLVITSFGCRHNFTSRLFLSYDGRNFEYTHMEVSSPDDESEFTRFVLTHCV